MTQGLSRVPAGAALIASCTDLNCPSPFGATVASAGAARPPLTRNAMDSRPAANIRMIRLDILYAGERSERLMELPQRHEEIRIGLRRVSSPSCGLCLRAFVANRLFV